MFSDNLIGTKAQSAAKPKNRFMKNKTELFTKKRVNVDKLQPKLKQTDSKTIIITNKNIGLSKKSER